MKVSSAVGAVSTMFVRDKLDRSEFQCGNCLLVEDYRLEVTSLITQVASLRKKLGKRQSGVFTFSTPVAEWHLCMLDASPSCR